LERSFGKLPKDAERINVPADSDLVGGCTSLISLEMSSAEKSLIRVFFFDLSGLHGLERVIDLGIGTLRTVGPPPSFSVSVFVTRTAASESRSVSLDTRPVFSISFFR